MKKIILLAAITVFGVATSNAQTAKKATKKADAPVKVEIQKVDGPGMVFENETIDF
jgi:glycine cleavage system regulatory protein